MYFTFEPSRPCFSFIKMNVPTDAFSWAKSMGQYAVWTIKGEGVTVF